MKQKDFELHIKLCKAEGWDPLTGDVYVNLDGYTTHIIAPLNFVVTLVDDRLTIRVTRYGEATVEIPLAMVDYMYTDSNPPGLVIEAFQ